MNSCRSFVLLINALLLFLPAESLCLASQEVAASCALRVSLPSCQETALQLNFSACPVASITNPAGAVKASVRVSGSSINVQALCGKSVESSSLLADLTDQSPDALMHCGSILWLAPSQQSATVFLNVTACGGGCPCAGSISKSRRLLAESSASKLSGSQQHVVLVTVLPIVGVLLIVTTLAVCGWSHLPDRPSSKSSGQGDSRPESPHWQMASQQRNSNVRSPSSRFYTHSQSKLQRHSKESIATAQPSTSMDALGGSSLMQLHRSFFGAFSSTHSSPEKQHGPKLDVVQLAAARYMEQFVNTAPGRQSGQEMYANRTASMDICPNQSNVYQLNAGPIQGNQQYQQQNTATPRYASHLPPRTQQSMTSAQSTPTHHTLATQDNSSHTPSSVPRLPVWQWLQKLTRKTDTQPSSQQQREQQLSSNGQQTCSLAENNITAGPQHRRFPRSGNSSSSGTGAGAQNHSGTHPTSRHGSGSGAANSHLLAEAERFSGMASQQRSNHLNPLSASSHQAVQLSGVSATSSRSRSRRLPLFVDVGHTDGEDEQSTLVCVSGGKRTQQQSALPTAFAIAAHSSSAGRHHPPCGSDSERPSISLRLSADPTITAPCSRLADTHMTLGEPMHHGDFLDSGIQFSQNICPDQTRFESAGRPPQAAPTLLQTHPPALSRAVNMSWSAGRSAHLNFHANDNSSFLSSAEKDGHPCSSNAHGRPHLRQPGQAEIAPSGDGVQTRACSSSQITVNVRAAHYSPRKGPRLPAVAALAVSEGGNSVWRSFKRRLGLDSSPSTSVSGVSEELAAEQQLQQPTHPRQPRQQQHALDTRLMGAQRSSQSRRASMSCDTSMSGNTGVLDSVNFRAAGSRTGQDTARIGYGAPSGLGYQPSTALETWEVGLGQQLAGWQLQQQNHQNNNQGFLQQQNSNLHGNSTAEQWSQADTPYVYSSGGNMDNSFTAGNPRGRRGSIIFSRDDIQVTGIQLGARHPRVSSHSTSHPRSHTPQQHLDQSLVAGGVGLPPHYQPPSHYPPPTVPTRHPSMLNRSASIPDKAYAFSNSGTLSNYTASAQTHSSTNVTTTGEENLSGMPQFDASTDSRTLGFAGQSSQDTKRFSSFNRRSVSFSISKSLTSSYASGPHSPCTHPSAVGPSRGTPPHSPTIGGVADCRPYDPRDPNFTRGPGQPQDGNIRLLQGHGGLPRSPTLSLHNGQATTAYALPPLYPMAAAQPQQQPQPQQNPTQTSVSAALQKLSEVCFTASSSKASATGGSARGGASTSGNSLSPAGSKSTAELVKLAWGRSSTLEADPSRPRGCAFYANTGGSVSGCSLPQAGLLDEMLTRPSGAGAAAQPPPPQDRDSSSRILQKLASHFDSDVEDEDENSDGDEGEVGIEFKYDVGFSMDSYGGGVARREASGMPEHMPGRRVAGGRAD